MHPTFASPYPQTPTPGGSATANLLGRPPLTSLKPFGYSNTPRPLIIRKPHPLAQVSMIDSSSANDSHSRSNSHKGLSHIDITLNQPPDQSLEDDLRAFELEQKSLHNRPQPRPVCISDDLTSIDDDDDRDEPTEQDEDDGQLDEQSRDDEDDDSLSFQIGLSSLSPPGIGRAAPRPSQLSVDGPEPEEDLSFQAAQEFSRDLSALSLSPLRRPAAPTPKRARGAPDDPPTVDDERSQGLSGLSGFQGMARQLRREFEQITGIPSPGRSSIAKRPKSGPGPARKDHPQGGTLKGALPPNGRAKRVFGTEIGLKPARLQQLHSAGLASTPPARPSAPSQKQQPWGAKSGLLDFSNTSAGPPLSDPDQAHKPSIRIVDASSDSAGQSRTRAAGPDSSLPPGARKIVGNSIRVPDVTGLTDALCSPEKADLRSDPPPKGSKPSSDSAQPDPTLSEALTLLRRRLAFLEAENEACQGRIRDLQQQLGRAQGRGTGRENEGAWSDGQAERATKPGLERMVVKLKAYTRRLHGAIEAHAVALDELNGFRHRSRGVRQELGSVKTEVRAWSEEVEEMRAGLEGLTGEVRDIRTMVEGLMKTASQSLPGAAPPALPGMSRRGAQPVKPTELRPPLSKSQQEAKRQARPPPIRTQSQQTRHGIEEWRSQASTTPGSHGRSFIGADEIERLRTEVEEEQSLQTAAPAKAVPAKAAVRVPTGPAKREAAVPASAPAQPGAQVIGGPVASTSKTGPVRMNSAPNLQTQTGASGGVVRGLEEVSRGEAIVKSVPRTGHDDTSCSQCRLRRREGGETRSSSAPVTGVPGPKKTAGTGDGVAASNKKTVADGGKDHNTGGVNNLDEERRGLAPQTVLVNVLKDLEEDFEVHRKIFVELSDTYKKMKPSSIEVVKRKALALHLKESVDTLEKKAGHIKHLYDLLHFKDCVLTSSTRRSGINNNNHPNNSSGSGSNFVSGGFVGAPEWK